MLLKIKDIVWESFKIPFKMNDLVCVSTSAMTDRPILGIVVDIQLNVRGRVIQYLVSYENQKSWFYEEELLEVQQDKNNDAKIGFK